MIADPANTFTVYGSVTIDGKLFSGLLLQGIAHRVRLGCALLRGYAHVMSNFDLNVNLTGGRLQQVYGPDAYIRISSELGSTFDGTYTKNFLGLKTMTNVRAYNAPSPSPVPEPSTFAILLACSGAGLLYHQRRRIGVADLTAED